MTTIKSFGGYFMKTCPYCGNQNEDSVKFCVNCGASMADVAPASQFAPVKEEPVQSGSYEQPNTASDPYAYAPTAPVQTIDEDPGKGCGIASLILGIFGVLPPFHFLAGLVGLILGIVGSSKSKKAGKSNGTSVAGIVLSVIALVVAAAILIGFIAFVVNAVKYGLELGGDIMQDPDQWQQFFDEFTSGDFSQYFPDGTIDFSGSVGFG